MNSDLRGQLISARLGKTVLLTAAGNPFLPKAIDMLNQADDIKRLASNLDNQVLGKLTLGTSHHIGLHRLPPVLKAFTRKFTDVDLDIKFMDSEVACHAVEMGELEIAVVTLPHTPSDKLVTQLVWPDPLVIVVNKEHDLASIKQVSFEKLAEHPAVIPGKGTYTREILDAALKENKVKPQIAMATNYLETLKMLATIGLGWTLLPVSMLDEELVQLKIPSLKLSRSLGIVTHRDRTLSNPALAMMEICQAQS